MSSLTNEQLLLLDNLIYMDGIKNGQRVSVIVKMVQTKLDQNQKLDFGGLNNDDWQNLINAIRKEDNLLNYTVTNYTSQRNGMRAATFVDNVNKPTDINVVFRGTNGSYEWHDNGTGGYLSDTVQQKRAADYINNLPASYGNEYTATGHSKGANKAQYVTIVTDRVVRCVSEDGQGFSPEFIRKYQKEIQQKKDRILSISAKSDYVNCLMIPIAGTQLFIDTEEQENFIANHFPHIILDQNGNLRDVTEQSALSKAINEYTAYIISNVEDPERSYALDGLLALMENGAAEESVFQTVLASGIALGHIDDFAFDYIAEHFGVGMEQFVATVAVMAFPRLFIDDYFESLKDGAVNLYQVAIELGNRVIDRLKEFGERLVQFGAAAFEAVRKFAEDVTKWVVMTVNTGYKYATQHPQIKVDTNKLRDYAQRIDSVNRRLKNLDRRMDSLYWKVGFLDLLSLVQADLMTHKSLSLTLCSSYLKETANDFESAERNILNRL